MPTTKYKISEQVLVLLEGGDRKQAAKVEMPDVQELVGQVINQHLKATHFSETMAGGERIPNGLMLATYRDLPVVQQDGRSKIVLPAFPIQLPRGVGIFQVIPKAGGVYDSTCEYIPVPPGQWWMIQKEGLLSDLLGQIGYENFGSDIIFTKDITTQTVPVTFVMVRMAIVDINSLSDFDMLPIPADMESTIVKEVYNLLTAERPNAAVDDPTNEQKGAK